MNVPRIASSDFERGPPGPSSPSSGSPRSSASPTWPRRGWSASARPWPTWPRSQDSPISTFRNSSRIR
eukprot:7394410-Pyramimonas_sp.AAC.1